MAMFSLNLIRFSKVDALQESDRQRMREFHKNPENTKRPLLSQVSLYDRPKKLTLEQIKEAV
jgi:hypothetical protein